MARNKPVHPVQRFHYVWEDSKSVFHRYSITERSFLSEISGLFVLKPAHAECDQ